ncbi:MAG: right-handed parallel beta-helix repeat-containing protein, partial [Actinomycetota bacterium]
MLASLVLITQFNSGSASKGNLLFATGDGTTTGGDDAARQAFFESLGWTVTVIDGDDAGAAALSSAAAAHDVLYVSNTLFTGVGDIRGLDIGIVSEGAAAWRDLTYDSGFAVSTVSATQVNVIDDAQYVTSTFATGSLSVLSGSDSLGFWNTSARPLPASAVVPVERVGNASNEFLITFEAGDALFASNTAADRRLLGGWGATDQVLWTSDMESLVERSLDWASSLSETDPRPRLLFVTGDGGVGSGDDSARRTLFESQGWRVSVIDDDAGVPALTTAADAADVMYISDTASNAVGASIRDLAIGVVAEDVSNWQILMYGSSNSTGFTSTTQVRIADNTVFPTSSFSVGTVTTAPSAISHSHWRDDVVPLPAGAVPLIEQTADTDNKFLVTFESGSAMYSANSAAGRRVLGGWANASTSGWGPNLDAIVARSLIWAAGILVVNSTGDGADTSAGDGLCSTGGTNSNGDAECTLRAAIQEANAPGAVERIAFDVPATETGHSGGIWTIAVASALPPVTATLRIDAQTQPGWAGNPIVVVDGSATGGGADGFTIDGSNSELRGFVIRDFPDDGVNVDGTGGHTVAGNWIGLAADGSTAAGITDDGIAIRGGSTNKTIGGPLSGDRNVVSANGGEGILDQQGGNVIEGNYFGTDVTGLLDRGNGDEGVDLNNSPGTVIRNNVISGNGGEGMQILGSNGSIITGNFIGVGADGTTPIGNDDDGITINFGPTDGLQIGGISSGEGNVIAHNGDEGVTVFENGSDDNAVLGNSIHSNGALGIDHGGAGVSANDANDTDSGPNDGLNFPVITGTTVSTVDFDLDVPAGDYLVEAFRNPSGNDATGNGEGEISLGFHQIAHTGSGSESFTGSYSGILSGGDITMTATECTTGACTAFGSTS